MIDFVKISNTGLTSDSLKNLDFLAIYGRHNIKTGEVMQGKDHARYRGLLFKESSEGVIGMEGSLHKHYNAGTHNYDDFTYGKLKATLKGLETDIGIDPSSAVLNNIELGVNIKVPFNPNDFIDSLVCYKYNPFIPECKQGMNYAQVKNTQYYVKIYNKGLQYDLPNNILRFEIKIIRMAKIAKYGITTLHDLTIQEKLGSLKSLLLDAFDSIIFCDDTIDSSNLSQKDAELLRDGNNSRFWSNHYKQTGSNASKKVRHYRKLIKEHGAQQFYVIRDMISDKWDYLVNNKDSVRVFTELGNDPQDKNVRVFTKPDCCQQNIDNGNMEPENTSSYTLSIEKELVSSHSVKKKCLVTGHDISMQKDGSRFLGAEGIRFIYKKDPVLFNHLLSELTPRWRNEPLERQFYGIAHHVRDKFFNKRNPTRRAIENMCSKPTLFDNTLLISEEKKRIAYHP